MQLELILIELRLFKLCYFWQLFYNVGYVVWVINFYNFQWIIMKLWTLVMDILKICIYGIRMAVGDSSVA